MDHGPLPADRKQRSVFCAIRPENNIFRRTEKVIDRNDMLELTRRMNLSRSSFDRVAGCYLDRDGEIDGTFNTNFPKLSPQDRQRQMTLAKTVPFSRTNEELKDYRIRTGKDSMQQLLFALVRCGLKNDALMDILYEQIAARYRAHGDYGIFVSHASYDMPVFGSDGQRMEDSVEVYEFLIATLCPVSREYEPGKPIWGFLYPAFSGRSADPSRINIYDPCTDSAVRELTDLLSI